MHEASTVIVASLPRWCLALTSLFTLQMLAQICKLKFMCSLLYFDCSKFWLCLLFFVLSKIWSVTIYLKTEVSFLKSSSHTLCNYASLTVWNHWWSIFLLLFSSSLTLPHSSSHSPKKCLNTIYLPTYVYFSGRKCTNHTRIFLSSYKWIIYRTFSQHIIHWGLMYTLVLLNCFIYRYVFTYKTIYEYIKTMHTNILYIKG